MHHKLHDNKGAVETTWSGNNFENIGAAIKHEFWLTDYSYWPHELS